VRKNQLMMAELARRSGLPLVLVGHIGSRAYADMVVAAGGGYAHLINRVDPHSQDLLWLYQNCTAFLSLSWAEGASLSALEAAASGASMLLTETSSEREYFDTLARFTGPLDVETALTQLQAAIVPRDAKTKQDQHQKIATRFGWQAHLAALGNIYEALL
jgi:glycosyltransferase involved in cell wall biosynthesis